MILSSGHFILTTSHAPRAPLLMTPGPHGGGGGPWGPVNFGMIEGHECCNVASTNYGLHVKPCRLRIAYHISTYIYIYMFVFVIVQWYIHICVNVNLSLSFSRSLSPYICIYTHIYTSIFGHALHSPDSLYTTDTLFTLERCIGCAQHVHWTQSTQWVYCRQYIHCEHCINCMHCELCIR